MKIFMILLVWCEVSVFVDEGTGRGSVHLHRAPYKEVRTKHNPDPKVKEAIRQKMEKERKEMEAHRKKVEAEMQAHRARTSSGPPSRVSTGTNAASSGPNIPSAAKAASDSSTNAK